MKTIPIGLLIIFLVVVLLPLGFMLIFERVLPMEIGVRQNRWGGGGVAHEDFTPGFRLGVWGMHKWFRLPAQTHFLHFSQSAHGRSSATAMWQPALELRTKDNNVTTIDITIPYRIRDGEGWKIIDRGLRGSYQDRAKSTVEDVLRAQLSELSSEDLQSTEMRLDQVARILPVLNDELAEFYVEAEIILIRRVAFPPDYENELIDKQFLSQKGSLDSALALVANEEQRTNSIEKQIVAAEKKLTADWEKQIQSKKSEYEVLIAGINAQARVYEATTRADADAEQVTLLAEGQLAIDKAEALRNDLRNGILNSRGGQIFLALQAAENLDLPSITLNSNDPRVPIVLDLDAMTELLVGPDGK